MASKAPLPDTIEGLRCQNSAYRVLCVSLEQTQAIQSAEGRKYHEAITTLDSEREANARLTEENERLRIGWGNDIRALGVPQDQAIEKIRTALTKGTPP